MGRRGRLHAHAAALAAVAVGLAGCAGESVAESPATPATTSASSETPPAGAEPLAGAVHIHGLGVDPADGALVIAAHTGLWRLAPGVTRAERVGETRQDTMGFSVVGPNRFLGSGHPDPAEAATSDLPPLLGLIESEDGGESWTSVSLWGEADFHILRVQGRRVYGHDATSGRLLMSADGGVTWEERATPGLLLDVAVDPANVDRLIATSDQGITESLDGGATWDPVVPGMIGLLAWDATGDLYLVDGAGTIAVNPGGVNRTWRPVGSVDSPPAAFLAERGILFLALHDGSIRMSRDGGTTWALRGTT